MTRVFGGWPLLLAGLAAVPGAARGQAKEPGFLEEYAITRRYMSGRPAGAELAPDGKTALFLRAKATSPVQSLFELDLASGETKEVLTAESLLAGAAEKLSAQEKALLERQRITARGFTSFALSKDGTRMVVALAGKLYLVERPGGKVTPLATGEVAAGTPTFSPDGKKLAFVRSNDLWVIDLKSQKARAVTEGGKAWLLHGLAEFVAQEEMDRFRGFWWSPDSSQLAFAEVDESKVEKFHLFDLLHPESPGDEVAYPRAGATNATVRLGLVSVSGGRVTWVRWDQEKYPYLATVVWPKKGPLSLLVQSRTQKEEVLLAVTLKNGATQALLTETDSAWLNLDQDFPHWLEDGSGFFWRTERRGAPEVELRDQAGRPQAVWVEGAAGFADWVGYDEKAKVAYFTGSPNPTESVVWRVSEGQKPQRFAPETGSAWQTAKLAEDGSALLVTTTSTSSMPRTFVYRADGSKAFELPSMATEPKIRPQIEIQQVGGKDGPWAAVLKPANHKKGTKLPVVVEVYGGPGHTLVRQSMRDNLLLQWLADQGFWVVKFDGRGTPRRGRDFERAIAGDFSKLPLEDQVAALKALGAKNPDMDLGRVGVDGWSFGGYLAALAVLKRPDVFKAAVAGAPVVDWKDYDTHYTERYLGLPSENGAGYEASSLLTWAPKLERPLMLIHGTADDNVYFLHSLKLSDALLRAGKPHLLVPLAGLTHMAADPVVTERLWQQIAAFFKKELQAQKSPAP